MIDRLEMILGEILWQKTLDKASFTPVSVKPTLEYIPNKLHSKSPTIPLGVDCSLFKPNNEGKNGEDIKLLFVGKVEEHKGIKILLEALKKEQRRAPDRSALTRRIKEDKDALMQAMFASLSK